MKKIEFGLLSFLYAALLLHAIIFGRGGLVVILFVQIFVGIYQLVMSVIRTIKMHQYSKNTQTLIKSYWVLCLVYFPCLIVMNFSLPYILGAWLIALYYYYVTYSLAFPKYVRSHLDI
jgi:hypothetical protein